MLTFLTGLAYILYQELIATDNHFSGWLSFGTGGSGPSNAWILFGASWSGKSSGVFADGVADAAPRHVEHVRA